MITLYVEMKKYLLLLWYKLHKVKLNTIFLARGLKMSRILLGRGSYVEEAFRVLGNLGYQSFPMGSKTQRMQIMTSKECISL